MIRIACTNCKTVLSIDDAFAGGVCRCQHCGTIQTVPTISKAAARAVGASVGTSKSLYQNDSRGEGTGLDDLANVVASSGLSSGRLRAAPPGKLKNMMPIFVGVAALVAVLLVIILWLALRGGSSNTGTNPSNPINNGIENPTSIVNPAPTASNEPNFCGVKLTGSTIIYLIDRGSATGDIFGALKDATLKSVLSLGSDHQFQIIFWDNGSPASYPESSPTYATPDNVESARRAIDDVNAYGATDILPALTKALAHGPDTIVIATAKGYDLDDAWVDVVIKTCGPLTVKIDTISLGSVNNSPALKTLAAKTGGQYAEVSTSTLRSFAGQ